MRRISIFAVIPAVAAVALLAVFLARSSPVHEREAQDERLESSSIAPAKEAVRDGGVLHEAEASTQPIEQGLDLAVWTTELSKKFFQDLDAVWLDAARHRMSKLSRSNVIELKSLADKDPGSDRSRILVFLLSTSGNPHWESFLPDVLRDCPDDHIALVAALGHCLSDVQNIGVSGWKEFSKKSFATSYGLHVMPIHGELGGEGAVTVAAELDAFPGFHLMSRVDKIDGAAYIEAVLARIEARRKSPAANRLLLGLVDFDNAFALSQLTRVLARTDRPDLQAAAIKALTLPAGVKEERTAALQSLVLDKGSDGGVRKQALQLLTQVGRASCQPFLEDVLQNDTDPEMRRLAATLIKRLK